MRWLCATGLPSAYAIDLNSQRKGIALRNTLLSFILAALLLTSSGAKAITLAKDGKPVATIVVRQAAIDAKPYQIVFNGEPGMPDQKVKWAAEDLQRYLEKISGARLPIVSDAVAVTGPVILVGASKQTEQFKDKIPAGLTPARLEEGFIILCQGDRLLLAGNDEGPYQGTIFGVAEFLNRLGVRWFMPGAFGEVVPQRATIEFARTESIQRPDFAMRSYGSNIAPELDADLDAWKLHNKNMVTIVGLLAMAGDGSIAAVLPDKELVQTHPEYFGKNLDGSVNPAMVNLTHPDTPRLVADKIKAWIKAEQARTGQVPHSLGVALYDAASVDFTKGTMAVNRGFTSMIGREGVPSDVSVTEEWFLFMNKVAAEVAKEFPDFVIATNGYYNRDLPPEGVTLHPNLAVMFAPIWSDTLHAYDDPKSWQTVLQGDMLKRWCELNHRVYVYGYNYTMLVTAFAPVPVTRKLARNYPLMKKWGVYGFSDEGNNCWMTHGIPTFYLRTKLQWDADLNVKATLKDFYDTWYGPATVPAQAFWDAIEKCLEDTKMLGHEDRILPYVYTPELLATLEKQIREAEKLATAEPYRTRVRVDRLILEHLKGYMAMNEAEFNGNYREAIKWADFMFQQRAELNHISPFLYLPEGREGNQNLYSGAWYWNLTDRKEFYEKMLARMDGPSGELIAQSPRRVKFHLDPANVGRLGRWFAPAFDRRDWRTIDTTQPFYIQGGMMDEHGVPYKGAMWYVFEPDVPGSRVGKPVQLYAPIVTSEAWVWVNGRYIGHRAYRPAYERPAELSFDVTDAVKEGRNVIGVLVRADCLTEAAEGFQGPLFLYAPKATE